MFAAGEGLVGPDITPVAKAPAIGDADVVEVVVADRIDSRSSVRRLLLFAVARSALMQDLQEKLGIAFLFISHDIAVVERVSHRIAVMYRGEIVETGETAQVLRSPHHPYTKRLLSAVPSPLPRRPSRANLHLPSKNALALADGSN